MKHVEAAEWTPNGHGYAMWNKFIPRGTVDRIEFDVKWNEHDEHTNVSCLKRLGENPIESRAPVSNQMNEN